MLVELMPQTNAFLLKRIISLCKVLCENEESSGMNIESVAICVGPNLSESLSCYDKFFEVLIKNFDNVFRVSSCCSCFLDLRRISNQTSLIP